MIMVYKKFVMPVPKITLSASNKSVIHKFIKWYEKEYEYKSPKGTRIMKGKWNSFLVEVLETLMTDKGKKDYQAVFENFIESKDKTEDEKLAEKAFAKDPEKLKTFKQLQKELEKHRK